MDEFMLLGMVVKGVYVYGPREDEIKKFLGDRYKKSIYNNDQLINIDYNISEDPMKEKIKRVHRGDWLIQLPNGEIVDLPGKVIYEYRKNLHD